MRDIREGMIVRTPDGEKLGKVASVLGDEFVIEKGLLFKHDYTARCDRIVEIGEDEIIYEPVSAEELEGIERQASEPDEIRVPLAEERLEVERRATQRGAVRVTKQVVTENKQVTVPVTREEVTVERVPASERAATEASFQRDEITVPVVEEEVTVTKRPVVREEVRVRKQEVQEQRVASAEVRREEAEIEDLRAKERPATTETAGGMRAPGRDDEVK